MRKRADIAARRALGVCVRVKEARERLGMSIDALAKRMDVHHTVARKWEAGEVGLSESRVIELARVLGVSVGSLYGEGEAA